MAHTWRRHVNGAAATLGVELAGATRHGELRRGAQREEGTTWKLGLTLDASGRDGVTGGEVECGGADRLDGGDVFGRRSGEGGARTGTAVRWRRRR